MDIRDLLVDGTEQLFEWLDDGLEGLSAEQLNWLPEGKATSIGFNAWHITRTDDNIVNFVFQGSPPIWLRENYVERFGLPKVAQGTGMALDEAQSLTVSDPALLREYAGKVGAETIAFIKAVDPATLEEIQLIKPLGEMRKWRVLRQVVMTHGFMHLGEINASRGMQGLQFFL
jgi:hypothetical protein